MIHAYDLETTRIQQGTPRLKYITAFGDNGFKVSKAITGDNRYQLLCDILENRFLIPDHQKAKFIAWNGNGYDVYFIALALLKSDKWVLQPYMTASKAVRGLKVKSRHKMKINNKWRVAQFEFLDGISMTGIVGKKLSQFLETFAPDLPKLSITCPKCGANCSFDKCLNCGNDEIEFNHYDPKHIAYADRDSEGLYRGMKKVQSIIHDLTEMDLKPTIGNLAVNYFMSRLPLDVTIKNPQGDLKDILHGPVKRGGFCWCMKPYMGKVWKYDINQAYAAAMRDARLPCGETSYTEKYIFDQVGIYEVSISRQSPTQVPFYYKIENDNVGRFALGDKIVRTWITSVEVEHLLKDKWNVEIHGGYIWSDSFNFSSVVGDLEKLRGTDPLGSTGPLGTMVKALGNNAYGKTLEQLDGVEFIIANDCPEGYDVYEPFKAGRGINNNNALVFSRNRTPLFKNYHCPQIGVFVTAYVRCVVRQTALKSPDNFLYADTDCVVFSSPVKLDIDKKRYGAWKIEAEAVPYIIIGKKIYHGDDGTVKAKGLRTKELTKADFEKWLIQQPEQDQTQRQNFLKFLNGNAMFKTQNRKGTNVENSKIYGLKDGRYIPT